MTKLTGAAFDRAVAQAMGLKSVNNCEKWGKEMNEEDEAFEQLALKQGQWEHTSGWRKKQIAHMDVHSHPAEFVHLHRNDTLEEVAVELETKFTGPFGRDTVQSFVAYIRGMKR